MSVDFLSKNFPPFQVHHAKKPPRFYPDGFQRNVIDFYFIFSDCRLRKALYLQFSYFIWPLRWNNQILHKNIEVLPSLGIVIENAGLYPNLTGFDNLKELADLRRSITSDDIRFAMNRVGLDPADSRLYKKYSLGMKQRLIIAQAIMERPDVIMLDEPTNALDEESAANVRTIIREERERGAIVLLASHNREDIYPLADVIYHINDGRIDKIEMVKE